MTGYVSFFSGGKHAKRLHTYSLDVSVVSEIFFKMRDVKNEKNWIKNNMLANRCSCFFFFLLQISQGSGHANLIASYNSERNLFKKNVVVFV